MVFWIKCGGRSVGRPIGLHDQVLAFRGARGDLGSGIRRCLGQAHKKIVI